MNPMIRNVQVHHACKIKAVKHTSVWRSEITLVLVIMLTYNRKHVLLSSAVIHSVYGCQAGSGHKNEG